jgi:chemotaxis protein methyltransferase WspC
MSQQQIEWLLAKTIGLSAQIVGSKMIAQAIQTRMAKCGITDEQTYWQLLQSTTTEWEQLLAMVLVPETWFFRNQATFSFLSQYVKSNWLSPPQHRRILSVPCSTGEEPYSIAITCLEAGLAGHQFQIDAVDINPTALEQAQQGIYPPTAFRGQIDTTLQQRYFVPTAEGYQIRAKVQNSVRFMKGNLLEPQFLQAQAPYDLIFCRNLLIYWEEPARQIGIKQLQRLLSNQSILLVGHAEANYFYQHGFEKNDLVGAFSCRRRHHSATKTLVIEPPISNPAPQRFSQLVSTFSKPLKLVKPVTTTPSSDRNQTQPSSKSESPWQTNKTKSAEDWLNIAQQAADRGQLTQAFNLCKKCLDKQLDNVKALFLMGIICQALGWNSKAEDYFNKTVYLQPNHTDALNYLAGLVEYRGDKEQALHLRRRVQRIRQRG